MHALVPVSQERTRFCCYDTLPSVFAGPSLECILKMSMGLIEILHDKVPSYTASIRNIARGFERSSSRTTLMRRKIDLLQYPLIAVLPNANWPCLIQTNTSSVQDRGSQHRIGDRRQTKLVIVLSFRYSRIDGPGCIDKLLDGNVTIPTLAVEMAGLRRGVFHAVCG